MYGDVAGTSEEPRLLVIEADPAEASAMDALVERVLRAWGRIDILNNLAGLFKGGPALDTDLLGGSAERASHQERRQSHRELPWRRQPRFAFQRTPCSPGA